MAIGFIGAIVAAFEPIRHFAFAAPLREKLAPELRVTFHAAYAIYYRPITEAIVIIRVLHGARDADALAERGGFVERTNRGQSPAAKRLRASS